MRALIILLVLSQATARGGRGGGRGGSSRGSSRGSSSRGSWFSWGSRSRSSGYSTSSSTYSTSSRSYQSPKFTQESYQKARQKELDRQKLAESYAYGGENWGKRPNSKPKVPAVVPVVLTGSSHTHSIGLNNNHDGSNSEKSSMSKYVFGASSFSTAKKRVSKPHLTTEELIILDHLAYRRRRKRKKPDWDLDLEELFEDEDERVFFQYESSGEGSGSIYYRTYIEEVELEKVEDPCLTVLFRFNNPEWSCWVDVVVGVFAFTCFLALSLAIWNSRRTKSLTFD